MSPCGDEEPGRARHNMAQSAAKTYAEHNTGKTTYIENTSDKPTKNQETLKERWATQIVGPHHNNVGQSWREADHEKLWSILNLYVSSAEAAPWGCPCSKETKNEACKQKAPHNSNATTMRPKQRAGYSTSQREQDP